MNFLVTTVPRSAGDQDDLAQPSEEPPADAAPVAGGLFAYQPTLQRQFPMVLSGSPTLRHPPGLAALGSQMPEEYSFQP